MFTDSQSYEALIPECTNVAVGYYDQHSSFETQDAAYMLNLIDALVLVDWDALPVERDPAQNDLPDWSFSYGGGGGRGMSKLIQDYPDEIADFLVENGVGYDDIKQYINGMYGY